MLERHLRFSSDAITGSSPSNCTTTNALYFYWFFCFVSEPVFQLAIIVNGLRTGLDDSFCQ